MQAPARMGMLMSKKARSNSAFWQRLTLAHVSAQPKPSWSVSVLFPLYDELPLIYLLNLPNV